MASSVLTWERQPDGSLVIKVPAESVQTAGEALERQPCPDCPGKDRTIALLERPCVNCAVLGQQVQSLTNEMQAALALQRRVGVLEQELKQTRPAFEREQESLKRSLAARIGEQGEKDTRSRLLSLVGSHMEIEVTNMRSQAGDLQLRWTPEGAPRSALITVEVKTAEQAGQGMMRSDWLRQAEAQVQGSNADAGLLFFTGAVDATRRLMVKRDARVVVVGYSEDPGQILSGLMHAVMIAQQRMACESLEGKLITPEDEASARRATKKLYERCEKDRKGLYDVWQVADKAIKESKKRVQDVCDAVAGLTPSAAHLFPSGFATQIALPRERIVKPASKKRKRAMQDL